MFREAIAKGETITEAQEAACKILNVETHEAEFEILKMPSKKILGIFGGNLAEVRAYINQDPAQMAEKYLKDIFEKMGLGDIQITSEKTEDGVCFNLSGKDVSMVIGRRGETLDSLQYLAGLVANGVSEDYYRLTINTGNYREKREDTLASLGRRLAFKALKTGRTNSLEPMNPYERRIIHTAVQSIDGAISWSEGEGTNRHVVIGLDPKQRPARSNNRSSYKRDGYTNKPRNNNSKESSFNTKKNVESFQNEHKNMTGQAAAAPLYGKIETKK